MYLFGAWVFYWALALTFWKVAFGQLLFDRHPREDLCCVLMLAFESDCLIPGSNNSKMFDSRIKKSKKWSPIKKSTCRWSDRKNRNVRFPIKKKIKNVIQVIHMSRRILLIFYLAAFRMPFLYFEIYLFYLFTSNYFFNPVNLSSFAQKLLKGRTSKVHFFMRCLGLARFLRFITF